MENTPERARRIDTLRELMDRFASPDLTLIEAKALLSGFLEWSRELDEMDPARGPATSTGSTDGLPPPGSRNFAA